MISVSFGFLGVALLTLAWTGAAAAAFCTLVLFEAIARSTGLRRNVWLGVNACCFGIGMWAAQIIAAYAVHGRIVNGLDPLMLIQAGADAAILAVPAIFFATMPQKKIRHGVVAGIFFGIAVGTAEYLQIGAISRSMRFSANPSLVWVTGFVAFGSACAAVFLERAGRDRGFAEKMLMRIAGAGILSSSIVALEYVMMRGAETIPGGMQPAVEFASPMTIVLLGTGVCICAAGILAAAWLDRQAQFETARASHIAGLYERERAITTALQRALLPTALPATACVSLSCAYLPHSEETLVGGDWYDAFPLHDGRLALSIGDVAGHGLSAALSTSVVRQAVRTAALHNPDPAYVLTLAGRVLTASDHPSIVTAFFAVLDPVTLEIMYANAGHSPPLVYAPDRAAQWLGTTGIPLGIDDTMPLENRTILLPANGLFALYTDGCTEYHRDIIAGESRLVETAARIFRERAPGELGGRKLAERMSRRLFATIMRNDDAALLCVVPHPAIAACDIRLRTSDASVHCAAQAVERVAARRTSAHAALLDIVREYVGDAVAYAYPGTSGELRVRAGWDGTALVVHIDDYGRWYASPKLGAGSPHVAPGITREILLGNAGTSVSFRFTPALRRNGTVVRAQSPTVRLR